MVKWLTCFLAFLISDQGEYSTWEEFHGFSCGQADDEECIFLVCVCV